MPPRVAGGQESSAPKELGEFRRAKISEMTAMHARSDGEWSDFMPVEISSRMEDVSVLMKRGADQVSFPEDESRETVTILMSLGSVLVNCKVAELFCGDRVDDAAVHKASWATGWDIEDERRMKEVKRRVMDEEHGRTSDKLFELMCVTGKYLCYLLERFQKAQRA